MDLYLDILRKSKDVDNQFEKVSSKNLSSIKITFNTPKNHYKFKEVPNYNLSFLALEDINKLNLGKKIVFIIDESVSKITFVKSFIKKSSNNVILLPSVESKVKNKPFLDELLKKHSLNNSTIVVIGGGLLCNCGAYLAEQTKSDYILFPTTVLSMADGALGGKVRANLVSKDSYKKHYYKSYYEPNSVFLDERFLDLLPERQKQVGIVEIIKHGLFQSEGIYNFLFQSGKKLLKNKEILLKAILWNAELKKICLNVDSDETLSGSKKILRAGHDFSDKLEENEKLKIPHGIAVAIGIVKQLETENNHALLNKAKKIFNLFGIPYTLEDYENWK